MRKNNTSTVRKQEKHRTQIYTRSGAKRRPAH